MVCIFINVGTVSIHSINYIIIMDIGTFTQEKNMLGNVRQASI